MEQNRPVDIVKDVAFLQNAVQFRIYEKNSTCQNQKQPALPSHASIHMDKHYTELVMIQMVFSFMHLPNPAS